MIALIDERLRSLAEDDYKAFSRKIISTGYEVLGVRMPALKKFAKELATRPDIETWLHGAEFTTYEHILLYGLVLAQLGKLSLGEVFGYLDPLILRFDNWAHVDTVTFKLFDKHREEVLAHFLPLKTDEGEFTKRFFVTLLMGHFMGEEYIDATLGHLSEVPQGQYYVDMAIAWAVSDALVKHYNKTLPLLKSRAFSKFVHNKSIQKARESYRVPPERKEYLAVLKVK